MFLAYVDESFGDAHFTVAALILDEGQVDELRIRLDKVATAATLHFEAPWDPELHGYEIFHGTDGWKKLKSQPRARVAIYNQIVKEIVAVAPKLYIVRIDQHALVARQAEQHYRENHTREQVAWRFLLQRIAETCDQQDQRGLVIADEGSRDRARREEFEKYRQSGTPGSYRKSRLDSLVDTVHFAPSHHSRPLQAVDCALYIWQRNHETRRDDRINPQSRAAVGDLVRMLQRDDFSGIDVTLWP